jgi:hypothetical protein
MVACVHWHAIFVRWWHSREGLTRDVVLSYERKNGPFHEISTCRELRTALLIHVLNILTNILLKIDIIIYMYTSIKHLDKYFLTTTPLLLVFCPVTNDPPKRPIYEFPHRIYDVIFLWHHFFTGFKTSYFCDVISSPDLWRHFFVMSCPHRIYDVIFFVTSFPHRIYDVIFLWRHFLTGVTGILNFLIGFMTSICHTSRWDIGVPAVRLLWRQ